MSVCILSQTSTNLAWLDCNRLSFVFYYFHQMCFMHATRGNKYLLLCLFIWVSRGCSITVLSTLVLEITHYLPLHRVIGINECKPWVAVNIRKARFLIGRKGALTFWRNCNYARKTREPSQPALKKWKAINLKSEWTNLASVETNYRFHGLQVQICQNRNFQGHQRATNTHSMTTEVKFCNRACYICFVCK